MKLTGLCGWSWAALDAVDWYSVAKLTVSMFFLCVFLLYFRLMVGREADGPLWEVLGRSSGLCGWSWAALGASAGGLGSLSGPQEEVSAALGSSGGAPGEGSSPKVAHTRAGAGSDRVARVRTISSERSARSAGPEGPERSEAQSQFVQEII